MPTSLSHTDFHIHATYFRTETAREDMTVAGVVARCEALGLDAVGIGEHQNYKPKHPLHCIRDLANEYANVSSSAVQLFLGTEVDILDDEGGVSSSPELKAELGLDYHLAAVHSVAGMPSDTLEGFISGMHRRLMGATERCHFVEAIAHPWARRRALPEAGVEAGWPFGLIPKVYLEEWTEALAKAGKAVEINTSSQDDFGDPDYRAFLLGLRQAGVKVSVGSDAHDMERIGTTLATDAFLAEMGFKSGDTWMPEKA